MASLIVDEQVTMQRRQGRLVCSRKPAEARSSICSIVSCQKEQGRGHPFGVSTIICLGCRALSMALTPEKVSGVLFTETNQITYLHRLVLEFNIRLLHVLLLLP